MKKRQRRYKKMAAKYLHNIRLGHTRLYLPKDRPYARWMSSLPWWAESFQYQPRWRLLRRTEAKQLSHYVRSGQWKL